MKNLYINLGFYQDRSIMGKIAKFIINKATFIPRGALTLFTYNKSGDKAVVFHEIEFAWFKYYFRWQKIYPRGLRKDPHWRFENLTNSKL